MRLLRACYGTAATIRLILLLLLCLVAQDRLLEGPLLVRAGPEAGHVRRFPTKVAVGRLQPRGLGWGHVLVIYFFVLTTVVIAIGGGSKTRRTADS